MIASEYGYTFDQIADMTPREISVALNNISIRKHNEVALNANIHGHKMQYKQRAKTIKSAELSKEDEAFIDRTIAERFKKNGRK